MHEGLLQAWCEGIRPRGVNSQPAKPKVVNTEPADLRYLSYDGIMLREIDRELRKMASVISDMRFSVKLLASREPVAEWSRTADWSKVRPGVR